MVGITRVAQAAGTVGALPAVALDFANGITLSFTDSSAQSAAIDANLVRVVSTENVYYTVAADPTAASDGTSALLPAYTIEHVKITPGHKFAALRELTNGTLFLLPCAEV